MLRPSASSGFGALWSLLRDSTGVFGACPDCECIQRAQLCCRQFTTFLGGDAVGWSGPHSRWRPALLTHGLRAARGFLGVLRRRAASGERGGHAAASAGSVCMGGNHCVEGREPGHWLRQGADLSCSVRVTGHRAASLGGSAGLVRLARQPPEVSDSPSGSSLLEWASGTPEEQVGRLCPLCCLCAGGW
jgi:hypothetical protein